MRSSDGQLTQAVHEGDTARHARSAGEVPGNDHTGPGPNRDRAYCMSLVRGGDGATGTPFPTRGADMSVRQQPASDSARVASLPGPTSVRVACQVHGGLVEYDGYSNDAWSYLPDHGGHVSTIFVDVADARLPGVPTCRPLPPGAADPPRAADPAPPAP
ncbi:hypothetical protein [Streptomyces sp. NPDC021969]|uniref:hypothetical protein n=1 Tax=unclassified Streptomyces TaxID=2593676 RepID=UPI0033CF306B